jgi:hypothetical protein
MAIIRPGEIASLRVMRLSSTPHMPASEPMITRPSSV